VRFIVRLTEEVREAILGDYFDEYRKEFLKKYYDII